MKRMIAIFMLMMLGQNAMAFNAQYGKFQVNVDLNYASMKATVACVTFYAPGSEGEESPELYFIDQASYATSKILATKGLYPLKTLKGPYFCSKNSKTMVHVAVGKYAKKAEVLKAIEEANAAVTTDVIFLNNAQFDKDIKETKEKLILTLLETQE